MVKFLAQAMHKECRGRPQWNQWNCGNQCEMKANLLLLYLLCKVVELPTMKIKSNARLKVCETSSFLDGVEAPPDTPGVRQHGDPVNEKHNQGKHLLRMQLTLYWQ